MRDPPAARQQVEGELQRLHLRVGRDPPEVRRAVAGRGLRALHHGRPLELVVDERRLDLPAAPHEPVRERDRVLHRQLRPRPDREVRGVRGVAEEHDRPSCQTRFVTFGKSSQSERFEKSSRPPEGAREERSQNEGSPARPSRRGRAPPARTLDDERAHALVVGVGVDVEEPVLGLLEDEGEGVEDEVGAEPDVLRALRLDLRPNSPSPRTSEFAPSAPTTRSASGSSSTSTPNSSSTPRLRARRWRISSRRVRAIAENEWPSSAARHP